MANLTGGEIEALVIGLVLALGFIGAAFYTLKWLRRRTASRSAGPPRPEVASDRAYNRLAMARREADLLERQGVDVARSRDLIALADRSFRERAFDRAYELAQSAHESLVVERRRTATGGSAAPRGRLAVDPAPAPSDPAPEPTSAAPRSGAAPPLEPAAPGRLPKNKLESQFQLKLFEQELARTTTPPGTNGQAGPAAGVAQEARAAFDRGDFTEALRLALRGRRLLGGSLETLGPPLPGGGGTRDPPVGPGGAASTGAPFDAAEKVAAGERCAHCGHPVTPGDSFCRGCGVPHTPTACPRCGAARLANDTFCGKCGFRYS